MKVIGLITGILYILLTIINFATNIVVDVTGNYDIYGYTQWTRYVWALAQFMLGAFLIMFFARQSS